MSRSMFRSLKALALTSTLGFGFASSALAQETEEKHWYDDIKLGAFVDAYGAIRSDRNARPNGPRTNGNAYGGYPHEAYVQADGFALAFAGADLAYSGEKFGATISLRFGPGVNRFYAADQTPYGIQNITQAYATWKPFENLTLDMGQFGTIYGAEVAESWRNMNYSRGGLYYAMQPFWHTGLRANYVINDKIALNGLVVNGVNTVYENNQSPSLGLQTLITPIPELFIAVGYLGALNPNAGGERASAFDNFFDLVGTLTIDKFKLVLNADYNMYAHMDENWWGVSLAPGYAFTNWFGAAIRAEYLKDSAGLFGKPDAGLTTLTGTLDFKPVPNSGAVVLRPEFRYEVASADYFADKDNEPSKQFWSAHLGVVVTSMP